MSLKKVEVASQSHLRMCRWQSISYITVYYILYTIYYILYTVYSMLYAMLCHLHLLKRHGITLLYTIYYTLSTIC